MTPVVGEPRDGRAQLPGRCVMSQSAIEYFLNIPGPVVTPASNPHRAGAPNHHHKSGSGGNPMVDANLGLSGPGGDTADLMRQHILTAGMPGMGKGGPSLGQLVVTLLTENTALREQVESATAELDAANDAVVDLIGQLDEARADGGPQ